MKYVRINIHVNTSASLHYRYSIMNECWMEDPSHRPRFGALVKLTERVLQVYDRRESHRGSDLCDDLYDIESDAKSMAAAVQRYHNVTNTDWGAPYSHTVAGGGSLTDGSGCSSARNSGSLVTNSDEGKKPYPCDDQFQRLLHHNNDNRRRGGDGCYGEHTFSINDEEHTYNNNPVFGAHKTPYPDVYGNSNASSAYLIPKSGEVDTNRSSHSLFKPDHTEY